MDRLPASGISLIASVVVASFAFVGFDVATQRSSIFTSTPLLAFLVTAVAGGQALVIGVPLLLAISRWFKLNYLTCACVGIIVALGPWWLLELTDKSVVNSSSAYVLSLTAACGLLGGLTFFGLYRVLSPNNSSKPTPLRGAA